MNKFHLSRILLMAIFLTCLLIGTAFSETWDKTGAGSHYKLGSSVPQTNDGSYIISRNTCFFGAGSSEAHPIDYNPQSKGILEGSVTFSGIPCAPGSTFQVPPCNGPYPNYEIIVYRVDGETIEIRVNSNEQGNYRVPLTPGKYIIYTQNGPFSKKTNTLTIESEETTELDLVIDTGIQ